MICPELDKVLFASTYIRTSTLPHLPHNVTSIFLAPAARPQLQKGFQQLVLELVSTGMHWVLKQDKQVPASKKHNDQP